MDDEEYRRRFFDSGFDFSAALESRGLRCADEVLDLGCGPGQWTVAAAKKCRSVLAVDRNTYFIDSLQRFLLDNGVGNVALVVEDLSNFKPNRRFDFIVFYNVAQFLDPETMARLLKECAAENGQILFSISGSGYYVHRLLHGMARVQIKVCCRYLLMIARYLLKTHSGRRLERIYSRKELVKIFKSAGLTVRRESLGGMLIDRRERFAWLPFFREFTLERAV